MAAGRLTVAFSALMLWVRGKPIDVRMAMLSSGGELGSNGVAPVTLSLVERPESIMEGRARGSAKSEEDIKLKSSCEIKSGIIFRRKWSDSLWWEKNNSCQLSSSWTLFLAVLPKDIKAAHLSASSVSATLNLLCPFQNCHNGAVCRLACLCTVVLLLKCFSLFPV